MAPFHGWVSSASRQDFYGWGSSASRCLIALKKQWNVFWHKNWCLGFNTSRLCHLSKNISRSKVTYFTIALQKMMKNFMLSRRCSHMGTLIKDPALDKMFQNIKSILMLVLIKQVLRSMNHEEKISRS